MCLTRTLAKVACTDPYAHFRRVDERGTDAPLKLLVRHVKGKKRKQTADDTRDGH